MVTGATGLVGRAAIERISAVRPVYALTRRRPAFVLPANVTAIEHDLREPREPAVPGVPETIVHLAQSPRYREFPEGAADVFEVNVASTQRLLEWAVRKGVKRFIYASSGGVYGRGDTPFNEDAAPRGSAELGHYLASKRCGELISEAYGPLMTVVVLRLFFVYGVRQQSTMLIPRLVRSVLEGNPIYLQGQDGIRINPVHTDDVACAIEASLELSENHTINVAGSEVFSMRALALLIGGLTNRNPSFEIQERAPPQHLVGGIEKMCTLLGCPKISFAEGIKPLVQQYISAQ